MIVQNPEENVIGFKSVNWLLDDVPIEHTEVRRYLNTIYKTLLAAGKSLAGTEAQDDSDADDETREQELKDWLLLPCYSWFSINSDGEILLIGDDDDDNILLTGQDAAGLVPVLKGAIADKIVLLGKFIGKRIVDDPDKENGV